jgi:DNA-directed RNA polymerase I subunit RPA2
MNCSDYSTAWVCRNCGSLITLGFDKSLGGDEAGKEYCRVCDKEEDGVKIEDGSNKISVNVRGKKDRKGVMDVIAVPCKSSSTSPRGGPADMADVFRYLCAEMACMGIKLNVAVT